MASIRSGHGMHGTIPHKLVIVFNNTEMVVGLNAGVLGSGHHGACLSVAFSVQSQWCLGTHPDPRLYHRNRVELDRPLVGGIQSRRMKLNRAWLRETIEWCLGMPWVSTWIR